MPLLDRPTLVDRPKLVDRGDGEDEQDAKETEVIETETLGEGGGPVINHLEFEPGDYSVVAAANTAAVLASGQESGDFFEQAFINSAIQLKDLEDAGEDNSDLVRYGVEKGVAEIGLDMQDINVLREPSPEPNDDSDDSDIDVTVEDVEDIDEHEPEEESEDDSEEEPEEESEIETVEDDLEEVKDEEDG